jgi:hypothetical protein
MAVQHIAIRGYDLALKALQAVKQDGTPEGRHILKYLLGPKQRAERKAERGPADPDKAAWEKAYKRAMDALSIYIRTRDTQLYGEERYGVCCTCKGRKRFSELGDGHWQSTKHWGTKFHLFNNHAQCWGCNSKMMGNGRMPEHEEYIRLVHGEQWPAKLILLTKTDKREKTTKELIAIAEDLENRTAQHLARESNFE